MSKKKLFYALIGLILLAAPSAKGQDSSEKISITVSGVSIQDFLRSVESQCGYTFFYSNKTLEGAAPITLSVQDKPLEEVLKMVFSQTGHSYEIIGNKIALKKSSKINTAPTHKKATQEPSINSPSAPPASNATTAVSAPLQISGKVIDEKGAPLPGAGIFVVGTTNGTLSEADGSFSISVKEGQEIQFSFLGYKNESVKADRRNTQLEMQLLPEDSYLESVVVTALGIKRDEKSLGYAAQKVNPDLFSTAATSSNWIGSLQGQVAGMSIDKTNSSGAGSVRVTLRGESSVNLDDNGALFVIDGIPMFNTRTTSNAGGEGDNYGIDYGDGSADINPDDIESVTVLKGPAATALYGSMAANGVILITTKSADKDKSKFSAVLTSSFQAEILNASPDLQYEYGQGSDATGYYYYSSQGNDPDIPGLNSTIGMQSWGPRLDGTDYYQYYDKSKLIGGRINDEGNFERVATPYVSYGDWFKQFFQTGWNVSNSLQLNGKINKNNSIRVTFTDKRGNSMTPNTGNNAQSVGVKAKSKFTDWFKSEIALSYRRQHFDNIPTMSGNGSTSLMYSLWSYAPNINMDWAKHYMQDGPNYAQDRSLTSRNNVYFLVYECLNQQDRNRVYGNIKFDFDLYKNLTLMVRGGIDETFESRHQRQGSSTISNVNGYYSEQDIVSKQFSGDFLLRYEHKFKGPKINLTGSFGGSILWRSYARKSQTADKLFVPGVYTLANTLGKLSVSAHAYERQTNSLYGLLQFAYRDALFLDLTGRNDWSSTLPASNRSYFYPSVSASAVLNELIPMHAESWLDMLKIRASWAQVGHDTSPYRYEEYLSSTSFPQGAAITSIKANPNLRPESIQSVEAGLELRFFGNRLALDAAIYSNTTRDLIAKMPISYASGMNYVYTNAGSIRNRGLEINLSGVLIRTKDFEWKAGINWSSNKNAIISLGEAVDSWIIASYSNTAYMIAYEGGSVTSMYGKGFLRAPEGSYAVQADGSMKDVSGMIVLDNYGKPMLDPDLKYIGECAPEWKAGFNMTFSWKGLKLYVSLDGQYGGHCYSLTNYVLNYRGKGKATLAGREGGLVATGVVRTADGNYRMNTYEISKSEISDYYHSVYTNTNTETNFVSTQFIKLRDIRLEYNFPKNLLSKTKVLQGVGLSVYGNNLYCWTEFPGWDPEAAQLRGSSVVPGFETMQGPSGIQVGASVKLTF